MITFIIGLVILFGGAALYGKFCEKVFGPDDRKTPAYTKQDGVDFVPMREWKNSFDQPAEHCRYRSYPRTYPGYLIRTYRLYYNTYRKYHRRRYA